MSATPLLSSRALNTLASPIRRLYKLARQAEEAGKTVHYLNIGQPDVFSPKEFFAGLSKYQDKVVSYEISEGNQRLRSNWADYINGTAQTDISAEDILITTGASEALIFSFMVCCDPGSEVIVFEPTYANYIGFAAISGVNLIPVLTTMDTEYALPAKEDITSKLTSNTRAVLLCNPNNPNGMVYSPKELELILEICEEHNLFLVVDETYRDLIFDGVETASVLEIAGRNSRVIVVDSLSKRFSLCGARIGCIISHNQEFMAKSLNLAQARLASPSIEQFAAADMLANLSSEYVGAVCKEYQDRRDILVNGIQQIPGCKVVMPQGAFYSLVRLPVEDAEEFIKFLLSDFDLDGETAFLAPASGFYTNPQTARNKVRIAAVVESDKLARSVQIIARGLEAFTARSS